MEAFRDLLSALLEFILAVAAQWATLSTGGLVVAAWALWERKNTRTVPWPVAKKILVAFLFWAVFLAWKDQHQENLSTKNNLARQERVNQQLNAQLVTERQNVRNEQQNVRNREETAKNLGVEISGRDTQLNNRDSQISIRDAQASNLQEQIRKQQQTISDLLLQVGKAQQQEVQRVAMFPLGAPTPEPKIASRITSYILLTNKTVTPVNGRIICEHAIAAVRDNILGAGVMMTGFEGRLAPNAFQVSIASPAWNSTNALIITIFHEGDLGNCIFQGS